MDWRALEGAAQDLLDDEYPFMEGRQIANSLMGRRKFR
jgi:hypothetical protein